MNLSLVEFLNKLSLDFYFSNVALLSYLLSIHVFLMDVIFVRKLARKELTNTYFSYFVYYKRIRDPSIKRFYVVLCLCYMAII